MALPKQPRMYLPLWETLKKHKTVTVSCPAHLHKRVVKAVSKEKWMDAAFKKKEGWRKQFITYTLFPEENKITFRLHCRIEELLANEF